MINYKTEQFMAMYRPIRSQLPYTQQELKEITIDLFLGDYYLGHPNHPPVVVKQTPNGWTVEIMDVDKL